MSNIVKYVYQINTVYLKKDEVNLWVSHSIYQYWNKPNEEMSKLNLTNVWIILTLIIMNMKYIL